MGLRNRKGRFILKLQDINDRPEVLIQIFQAGILPYEAVRDERTMSVSYIALSDLFDEIPDYYDVPLYEVAMVGDADGNSNIIVTKIEERKVARPFAGIRSASNQPR